MSCDPPPVRYGTCRSARPALDAVPRIVDVIQFNGEWEVLNIRLHELGPVVDEVWIIEWDMTYSGKPKPFRLKVRPRRGLWSCGLAPRATPLHAAVGPVAPPVPSTPTCVAGRSIFGAAATEGERGVATGGMPRTVRVLCTQRVEVSLEVERHYGRRGYC